MAEQVDVIVVGLGPGGEDAAGRLAVAGLSVVGVERRLVGGECPYYGCVPSKMMIRAGNALAEARRVAGLAGYAEMRADWAPVAARIRDEATDDWNDQVAVDRLVGKGARFVRGTGRLVGPSTVEVSGVDGAAAGTFQARRAVVLATGTEPAVPPVPGLAGTPYWTNREAIRCTEVPPELVVLGGGSIGLELAQVFARFGSAVTVVEALDRILAMEEPESSEVARRAVEADGVTVHTGQSVKAVSHVDGRFALSLESLSLKSPSLESPSLAVGTCVTGTHLLVATGRRADLRGLGVDAAGLDPGAKAVQVDERMRAGARLYALGDLTGKGAFTHMAMYQADIVVRDILDQGGPGADYRAVPRVTFLDPEVGAVGMTEAQARDAGRPVRVALSPLPASARGWIHKAGNDGFIKLVADADRGVLLGATSAGPAGGEVLSALAVAVHAEVPVATLRHMIYAYPTFHRAIEDAVKQLD
jgi:pyruvate/2-oxoglutarate dehydrogenase complex dihydrolipoamide dehydrogenase (E3) component